MLTPRRVLPVAVSLAGLIYIAGCSGDPTDPDPQMAVVATVEVAVSTDTLTALDATSQFTATAKDAAGNTISGVTFSWTSSDDLIATVNASGLATARANGAVSVIATTGGKSGSSALLVSQQVETVTVAPPSASLSGVGATQQFTATAVDANNNPVTGVTPIWWSSNHAVATVDATGLATGTGSGSVTITAAFRGVPGTASLTVAVAEFASVDAGSGHTCGVRTDGAAYCWGNNSNGQLGDGTTTISNVPVLVAGGHTFASVDAGSDHTCAVRTDGAAYCWGNNGPGQLGDGTTTNSNLPVLVAGGHTFASVNAGLISTCGVRTDGAAYCWGSNQNGQLGDGTTTDRLTPTLVTGSFVFASVSVGFNQTCGVIAATGDAYCWGANNAGQLGDGTTTNSNVPVLVAGGHTFASVSAGRNSSTCGVTTDGAAYCWGFNGNGQLGDGTTTNSNVPTPVSGSIRFALIDISQSSACGATTTGAAFCWGVGNVGQRGDGSTTFQINFPVPVVGVHAFSSVSVGPNHACGVATDGVFCWGNGFFGQLGDGTDANSSTPVRVVGS